VSTTPPALPKDIEAGLRRLRLRAMRSLSPELLVTAKTQRWKPEEFLRTLIEAEIASRDASNAANRLKAASFPVTKTLEEFDVRASSVKQTTFDYLSSLEWVRAKENLYLVGPLEGILKADLILINEIGFAPMDHTGAQRFFRLVSAT
jgi:DNA replication protein DnaC